MRSDGPPVLRMFICPLLLRMFVCPLPTCPSRLLIRSRASAGTIPARAAAARSSRSAASIEDLSHTSDRVSGTQTALRGGAVSSHSAMVLTTLTENRDPRGTCEIVAGAAFEETLVRTYLALI